MPRCPNCQGLSYLVRGERNTYITLVLLGTAFLGSYPSPISNAYLNGLPQFWSAIIRIEIWALAVLTAVPVFAFTGRLTSFPRDKAPIKLISWKALVLEWVFYGFMLWWMYAIYRIAKTMRETPYAG